jgi:heme-degrading monooxygenase HmoA
MIQNSYSRMAICEAVADDAVKEIVFRMQDHIQETTGLISHSILVEEGGRMVILITEWPNRQECVTYHASRAYRQLVAATQHVLVGDYVVKLFRREATK